ncbi:hypothetical protein M408DRAFT_331023 [Serendipita vermifera MAFF 305830]|uniref:Uncharacterized protein n=1 Tax=Serendipita vermifera MAFF 305830 TaxID=933852 RepID=A0A0C3B0C2_SERVB|nr:hypothetical protein M408DRAFT_331023 [Serendipita vermifera MAFF 305830]
MAQDSSVIRRTTEARHIYVTNWSKNEWEAWKETVSEVLAGLARGYIGVGSTASARSLCRDPDNICSSIHNLIT